MSAILNRKSFVQHLSRFWVLRGSYVESEKLKHDRQVGTRPKGSNLD